MDRKKLLRKVKEHKNTIIFLGSCTLGVIATAYGLNRWSKNHGSNILESTESSVILPSAIEYEKLNQECAERYSQLSTLGVEVIDPSVLIWEENTFDEMIINGVKIEQLGEFGKKILECQPEAKQVHMLATISTLD